MSSIEITTQDNFADHTISQTLGLVRGNVVRSRNAIRNMFANLRTIVGGEIPEYTEVLAESREQALERLLEHARSLGADGIVGLRFITSEVGANCAEVLAYGTAVKFK